MIEVMDAIDLPSLTSFIGNGDNFEFYGSVILESIRSDVLLSRHPLIVVQ